MLKGWVKRLQSHVAASSQGEAQQQARRLCRGALDIVAACVPEASGDEVLALAMAWSLAMFAGCTGSNDCDAVDEVFLRGLLEQSRTRTVLVRRCGTLAFARPDAFSTRLSKPW